MKKKTALVNFFLVFAVLFAMLFQYVHSYEHVAQQLSEKKCHHSYASKHEITHQHHNFDHCFVCDFTLSHFIHSKFLNFDYKMGEIPSGYSFFKSQEITNYFKGSLFALRAPPIFIV